MFEVSDTAQAEIASYFADKELKPLRVFLHPGGCAGPELLMALDEKKDGDDVYKINGVEFVIEKPLLNEVQPVKIDFAETGFTIESSLKSEDAGCSGCCGGCGA